MAIGSFVSFPSHNSPRHLPSTVDAPEQVGKLWWSCLGPVLDEFLLFLSRPSRGNDKAWMMMVAMGKRNVNIVYDTEGSIA